MKKSIFTPLFLLLVLNLPAQMEEIVTLETTTGNVEGTLLIPESQQPAPVALIIAGSGPTDRNGNNPMMTNNSLKMLAAGLAENGIASLRYDKRGIGQSKSAGLKEIDLRFENYIDDARQWIEKLKKDDRFSAVTVIGHSEGSLIGLIAARKAGADKFISLAGLGEPANATIRRQLAGQPPFVTEQANPILEKLVQGETVAEVPPFLAALFRPSVQPYLISWFRYDPAVEIAKLEQPVLIIQGTTDIQVTVEDANYLATANPKAQRHIFEGMNHILKDAPADPQENVKTYSQPDLPLHEGLMETISGFIKK